jgi:DNA-directed RNA polymerase sigma subunit (sigma70/sigma32)
MKQKGLDSFAAYLPADETKIIRWLYMDKRRKTFGEISAEINLSERRIKQIANNILLKYYETANYDLNLILELL